jgi:dGTPase
MGTELFLKMRQEMDQAEAARLSPLACLSREALRRRDDPLAEQDHRQNFAIDADRVLHSLAYTRYIDKTQVFSLVDNDHITHRVLHVQLVSKIARTMGRFLSLNEDLIEAISLAHDIGHPPFGQDGEHFLDEKCVEYSLGSFLHNIQGVHFLKRVEKGGRGLNLSLQVLDGVICHDGEAPAEGLRPRRGKTFADLDREMAAKATDPQLPLLPMTLEGCVVRQADSVAYLGRDFEDAICLGLIRREELPAGVRKVLGKTNGSIVYRLVQDLIENSRERDLVSFSSEVAAAHAELKSFNYRRIYLHPSIKTEYDKIRAVFHTLFEQYLEDLLRKRVDSPLVTGFLAELDPAYRQGLPPAAVVRNFIAGMTDEYLLRRFKEAICPSRLPPRMG